MLGQIVGAVGTRLLDRFVKNAGDQIDKVTGLPTPEDPMRGGVQGQDYREFMDAAYPGTTPWERLGANAPYGSVTSADIGAKNALRLQEKELDVRERVAQNTNVASVIAASMPYGTRARQDALYSLATGGGTNAGAQDLQTQKIQAEIEQSKARIKELEASAGLTGAKAELEAERAKYKEWLAKLDVAKGVAGVAGSAVGGAVSAAAGWFGGRAMRVGSSGYRILRNMRNNSTRPARFIKDNPYANV